MLEFLALVEYHLVTNAAKMHTGDMDDAWMLGGRAFKAPTRAAALMYDAGRRWPSWFVYLCACTLLGCSLIQSTQSLSFVSHLRCHGSCVHTSDVTKLKEGGLAASAGTIQSPCPRVPPSGFFQWDTWLVACRDGSFGPPSGRATDRRICSLH